MYILAFKDGHDAAACLLKDGVIVAAAEEERFNRIKHAPSIFPEQAIRFCLNYGQIKEREVDYVVYARLKPFATALRVFWYYATHPPLSTTSFRYFFSHGKVQLNGLFAELTGRSGYQKIRKIFPDLPKKIYSFDHHLLHAASAYYFSEFEESLVITMDGKGEATSVMIASGQGGEIKILERRGIFESLGLFYSAVTKYLGFTPNDGEYKVMGLAAYGQKPAFDFSKLLRPDSKCGYVINPDFVLYPLAVKNFEKKFGPERKKSAPLGEFHRDFAAAAQQALEDAVVSLVAYATQKYPSANLCLGGGVAYNVKMNKAVWDSGLVKRMFVQPAAGDAGLVLGATALFYTKLTGKRAAPLKHLYFGPEFQEQETAAALREAKVKYRRVGDPVPETAKLLAEGKVVGWFQGRMEFGPRALGNRSVLANPATKTMQDMVNEKIKFRESFRPFCPSIIAEQAPEYFENYESAPFMITSFATKSGIKEKIPAVVHVDGTVRPQSVERETNPLFYRLLESFYKQTGIPVLLNTSMNIRGEPIVCSPQDAVNFFLRTNIDALVIGNCLALKSEQDFQVWQTLDTEDLKTEY